jgi:ubiquinone/menaquinone biosynthesis C-methylase UbiE
MFLKPHNPHPLVVAMIGVKMGDHLVQIGCADAGRLAAVASKVGLSGRAVAVVPAQSVAARVSNAAARAGVLVEIELASPTTLPLDDNTFDLAVVDDTSGFISDLRPEGEVATIREIARVLRPGGRIVFIGTSPRGGLGRLFTPSKNDPPLVASGQASALLRADGFISVRQLADRDGLVFVEAIKPR